MVEFNNKTIKLDQKKEAKGKKRISFRSISALYEIRELTLNAFRSGILPIKATQGKGCPSDLAAQLKMLTPKQMLHR